MEWIPQFEEVVINVSWLSARIVKWIASLVCCSRFLHAVLIIATDPMKRFEKSYLAHYLTHAAIMSDDVNWSVLDLCPDNVPVHHHLHHLGAFSGLLICSFSTDGSHRGKTRTDFKHLCRLNTNRTTTMLTFKIQDKTSKYEDSIHHGRQEVFSKA